MKKLALFLTFFSLAAFAYDSCPCPEGDPGHTDHVQIESFDPCINEKAQTGKMSLEQAFAECSGRELSRETKR